MELLGIKFKDLDKPKFVSVYNNTERYTSLESVGEVFVVSTFAVKNWKKRLESEGYNLIDRSQRTNTVTSDKSNSALEKFQNIIQEQKIEIKKLEQAPPLTFEERLETKKFKDSISHLQKDLREAERQAMTSDYMMELIWGMKEHKFGGYPDWLTPKKSVTKTNGIPCLFISDIHFDEYVAASQISFVNEYDREIATKRIQHTFNTTIDILFKRTVNPNYEGLVLALGGDMLSGNIHEELAETNEDSIMRSLLVLSDLLIDGIEKLLKHFDKIFVPCVVGNHGRLYKKPRAKNKVYDNFEWLVYQFIARHFRNDKRVEFLIPDSPDAHFRIYNQGFLLTHGDQFRGGNAIAGIFSPLMLGFHRKQKKQASLNKSFDVMMVGHFHQYVHTNNLIINGSIKGYDEYANLMNFSFEPPQQALFINHPTHGMVLRTPILCSSYLDEIKGKMDEKIVFFK